ncbi:hypothetical protein [Tenacibaculum sp. SG-28]|uniref:hypothetical protein n=1 Tax=Tenacibaculum sp. SG-28 TaxID=754426 RepID=UPI000CF44A63|nr:hypothetical protein [Tenacibaculum sp. SG-28]PQJ23444.1 hypothetical protein BSU00_04475 [Tenacibaculum sp. SG-28]
MKKVILKNGTQVLLIVFSVVLGLFLNEKMEERKNEKEATELLKKIKVELRTNTSILNEWMPYHREIVSRLDSLSANDKFIEKFYKDKNTIYSLFYKKSLLGETPGSDAWDIAKAHPLIVNLEYDILFSLSRIYKQQAATFEPLFKLEELLFSPTFNTKENAKTNLLIFKELLHELSMRELQLTNLYQEAEKTIHFMPSEN